MRNALDKIVANGLVVLMSVMVLSTLLQVFARFVKLNVPFTEELTVYAMMWVTLLGSAYAFGLRKHIAIDILSASLDEKRRWTLTVLTEAIIAGFAVLILLVGGLRFVYITFKLGQVSSVMQIYKGWIYLAVPFSGVLTVLYNCLNIRDALRERKRL